MKKLGTINELFKYVRQTSGFHLVTFWSRLSEHYTAPQSWHNRSNITPIVLYKILVENRDADRYRRRKAIGSRKEGCLSLWETKTITSINWTITFYIILLPLKPCYLKHGDVLLAQIPKSEWIHFLCLKARLKSMGCGQALMF